MPFAFVQEWKDATPGTANYDAIAEKLDAANNPPEGLIAHTAGLDSNGTWRIFDIWETREHAQSFYEGRLGEIMREVMQQAGDDLGGPTLTDSYELHDLIHP